VKALKDFRGSAFALGDREVRKGARNAASGTDDRSVGGNPARQQTGVGGRGAPIGAVNNHVPAEGAKLGHLLGEREEAKALCGERKNPGDEGVALQHARGFGVQKQVHLGMRGQSLQEGRHQQSLADAVVHAHQKQPAHRWKFVRPKAALWPPKQGGGQFSDEGFGP